MRGILLLTPCRKISLGNSFSIHKSILYIYFKILSVDKGLFCWDQSVPIKYSPEN